MTSMQEMVFNSSVTINQNQAIIFKSEKKNRCDEKMKQLEAAFERLYNNCPVILPKGSTINRANVAIEAGYSAAIISERYSYQHKLISKINYVQEIQLLKSHPTLKFKRPKSSKRAMNQRTMLKNLYLALNRLIDNTPIIVEKGSSITQANVSLEAGYSSSHITTRKPIFIELCTDIKKSRNEKEIKENKRNTNDSKIIEQQKQQSLDAIQNYLRQSLSRILSKATYIIDKNEPITMQNVCLEANMDRDFLKKNQQAFKALITKIEHAEIARQKEEFKDAIQRLKNGQGRVENYRLSRIDVYSVAIEAGYARNYLVCYKALFEDIIIMIKKL